MLSALIGPMLVFITGLAAPLGWVLPHDLMSYPRMLLFAHHWFGEAFLFLVIALFLWHGVHRIYHSLHDLGIRRGTLAKIACYGFALVGTACAAYALIALGF